MQPAPPIILLKIAITSFLGSQNTYEVGPSMLFFKVSPTQLYTFQCMGVGHMEKKKDGHRSKSKGHTPTWQSGEAL